MVMCLMIAWDDVCIDTFSSVNPRLFYYMLALFSFSFSVDVLFFGFFNVVLTIAIITCLNSVSMNAHFTICAFVFFF